MSTPTHHDAKAYAIAEIGRLMRTYDVDLCDLGSARGERQDSLITRIFAYVGGTLVVVGLCIYLGMEWNHLDSVLRVALTLGPGVISLIAAITIARMNRPSGHLIASPLFILSALFQSGGLFVFMNEFSAGGNPVTGCLMICGVMTLQYLALFYVLRSPVTLLLTLIFAHFFFASVFERMDIRGRYYSAVLGLSGLLIAGSLMKTRFSSITSLGFVFSGFTFATALFIIVKQTPLDLLLIGVAGVMIYASVLTQSRAMLAVAVITMLSYLGYYTEHYFQHAVGWPIALIAFGIALIIASSYAVKISRDFRTGK